MVINYSPGIINYAPGEHYVTGASHDDRHMRIKYFYSTGH